MPDKLPDSTRLPAVHLTVLLALHRYFGDVPGDGTIQLSEVGGLNGYGCNPGIARAGILWLAKNGWMEVLHDENEGEMTTHFGFTSDGAEELHDLLNAQSKDVTSETSGSTDVSEIPASDRFVAIDHNSDPFKAADQALDDLVRAVRDSNELELPSIDRDVAIQEIGTIKSIIGGTRIRVAAIWGATQSSSIIRWLSSQTASAAVQNAAIAAITALLSLVGLL